MQRSTNIPIQGDTLDRQWVQAVVEGWVRDLGVPVPPMAPGYVWGGGAWSFRWGKDGDNVILAVAKDCMLTISITIQD